MTRVCKPMMTLVQAYNDPCAIASDDPCAEAYTDPSASQQGLVQKPTMTLARSLQ